MNFYLTYCNTTSSKWILDILLRVDDIAEKGFPITIKWRYDADEEDILEIGEDYRELIHFADYQLIEVEEE